MTATLSENDDKNFGGFINTRVRGQEGALAGKTVSVTTSRSVLTAGLDSRNSILIHPLGDIFIGDVTVTAASGFKVTSGTQLRLDIREDLDLYAIASGTVSVTLLEIN